MLVQLFEKNSTYSFCNFFFLQFCLMSCAYNSNTGITIGSDHSSLAYLSVRVNYASAAAAKDNHTGTLDRRTAVMAAIIRPSSCHPYKMIRFKLNHFQNFLCQLRITRKWKKRYRPQHAVLVTEHSSAWNYYRILIRRKRDWWPNNIRNCNSHIGCAL